MLENPIVVNPMSQARPPLPSSREAYEVGARHRNWRGLWSNIGVLCATRITDVELMQSILCLVLPDNEDNEGIARLLIEKHGNFANAVSASLSDHDYVKGFPAIAGVALKLIYAAAERLVQGEATNRPLLSDLHSIQSYLNSKLNHQDIKQVRVLLLDASKRLLADECLAKKTSSRFRLDPVEVIRRAINWGATSVALVEVSLNSNLRAHLEETSDIRDLCERLNIHFLDHLVVRQHEAFSLRELGLL